MSTIEHFAIYAADAPELKDFYVEAFGLKVVVESGGDPPGYFLADDRGTAARDHRPARGTAGRQPALGLPPGLLGRRLRRRPRRRWNSAGWPSRPTRSSTTTP